MKLYNLFKKQEKQPQKEVITGHYNPLFTFSYDGEKNSGELGPAINYELDYETLRKRSWNAYLQDDILQTVIKRYTKWVIGTGLKLQVEPNEYVLKSENIQLPKEFIKHSEQRFKLYAESKYSDHSQMNSLQKISNTAYINSLVGGDVLVVLRYENGVVTTELIDGKHISTPFNFLDDKIVNGIEQDSTGKHIAFYVEQKDGTHKKITAYGEKTGFLQAFLVYGHRHRLNDNRGLPIVSAVLETLKKLERYKEATVGSAEERAKIVYQIVHEAFSTGENPMTKNLVKAFNIDNEQDLPSDVDGVKLARNVTVSTDKQTINMPVGAKLQSLESKQELSFAEFYKTNANFVCAAMGIPPEVAFSLYTSNFSSARAALKDWEHTLFTERIEFSRQFNQKVYNYWLNFEILNNKIQAVGYLDALAKDNFYILESYRNARFTGANVPHIDPLKEVKAEREKLGEAGRHVPLTTVEMATETLNEGDYSSNVLKYIQELEQAQKIKDTLNFESKEK